jgi:hypothetical protein
MFFYLLCFFCYESVITLKNKERGLIQNLKQMYKYTQLKAEITRIILRSLRMNFGVESTKYCWQNLIVPRDARVFTRWSIKPSKMVCMWTHMIGFLLLQFFSIGVERFVWSDEIKFEICGCWKSSVCESMKIRPLVLWWSATGRRRQSLVVLWSE